MVVNLTGYQYNEVGRNDDVWFSSAGGDDDAGWGNS